MLLLTGCLLPLAVILHRESALPFYWPVASLWLLAGWTGTVTIVAALLKRYKPERAAQWLLALVAAFFIVELGVLPVAATLLLLGGCTLLGQRVLRQLLPGETPPASLTLPFITGLVLYLALFSLLAHVPVNYAPVDAGLLALPLLFTLRRGDHAGARLLATVRSHWAQSAQLPFPVLVLLVLVLGFLGMHAFLPTTGFDDLYLHLRPATDLAWQHRLRFDFLANAWALSPFAVDLQHAVVSLIAGSDSRGALALAWASLLSWQLWHLSGRWLTNPWYKALLLLTFASTPMLVYLLQSLQTELFTALLCVIGVRVILEATQTSSGHAVLALLAMLVIGCAVKLSGVLLSVVLLVTALWHWRGLLAWHWLRQRPWQLLACLPVFVVAGFHSYLNAWRITGNPLFPLFNGFFKSPYFNSDSNLSDGRWLTGATLGSYWDFFFGTARHFEGRDYVAGFQYLLPLPLALLAALWGPWRRQWWPVVLPLLGFGVAVFASLQYWRYLFPVLPLASLLLAALLPQETAQGQRWPSRLTLVALGFTALLNLLFLPGITWIFQSSSPAQALTAAGRVQLLQLHASAALLNERLNATEPGLRVLYPDDTGLSATLRGVPLHVAWYAPAILHQASDIRDEAGLRAFLRTNRVDGVVWDMQQRWPPESQRWGLGRWLSLHAFPEFRTGPLVFYRLLGNDPVYTPLFALDQWAAANARTLPLTATVDPQPLAELAIDRARALRYHVRYQCSDAAATFIAQVNWDDGSSYYRLVSCAAGMVDFQEAVPVPLGVERGTLYLTARDQPAVAVHALTLERL